MDTEQTYQSTHTGKEIDDYLDVVGDHTTTINQNIQRIAALEAADTTLQISITNEAAQRKAADAELSAKLNAEIADRQEAGETLQDTMYDYYTEARNNTCPYFDGFVAGVEAQMTSIANPGAIVYDTTAKRFYACKSKIIPTTGGTYYTNWGTRGLYLDDTGTPCGGKIFIASSKAIAGAVCLYAWNSVTQDLAVVGASYLDDSISSMIESSEKGAKDGVAPLNTNAKIDEEYLPDTYRNAVMLVGMYATAPRAQIIYIGKSYFNTAEKALYTCVAKTETTSTGIVSLTYEWEADTLSADCLYVDTNTNKIYRWNNLGTFQMVCVGIGSISVQDITDAGNYLAGLATANVFTAAQTVKADLHIFGSTYHYDGNTADLTDDTVFAARSDIFTDSTNGSIKIFKAHILDIDTENKIATVRFTAGSIDTPKAIQVTDTEGNILAGGICRGGYTSFVLAYPYNSSGGYAGIVQYTLVQVM